MTKEKKDAKPTKTKEEISNKPLPKEEEPKVRSELRKKNKTVYFQIERIEIFTPRTGKNENLKSVVYDRGENGVADIQVSFADHTVRVLFVDGHYCCYVGQPFTIHNMLQVRAAGM